VGVVGDDGVIVREAIIFRIAEWRDEFIPHCELFLAAVVVRMEFAKKLPKNLTAAEMMAAFPGMPKSTAYDWIRGARKPPEYLHSVILAHLRSAVSAGKASRKPK